MSSSEERHEDIWEQSSVKDFFRKILTVQPNEEQKRILKEMIKEALKERDIGPIIQDAVKEYSEDNKVGTVRKTIMAFLQELGVPENNVGYVYLCETIETIVGSYNYNNCKMDELWEEVAKNLNVSKSAVMSAIYRIIQRTWRKGNKPLLHTLFKVCDTPTTKLFVFTIADKIQDILSTET